MLLPGGVPLEVARVPGGTSWMGAKGPERGADGDEYPRHQVTLARDFYLGTVEVTQAQWQAHMGANPAHDYGVGADHPVYYVSWDDIAGPGGFLEFLNQHLVSTGQSGAGLFRLPTEAESFSTSAAAIPVERATIWTSCAHSVSWWMKVIALRPPSLGTARPAQA